MSKLREFEKVDSILPFQAYSVNYESSSISYFAGYAAHATTKKWDCNLCKEVLLKPPEAEGDLHNDALT